MPHTIMGDSETRNRRFDWGKALEWAVTGALVSDYNRVLNAFICAVASPILPDAVDVLDALNKKDRQHQPEKPRLDTGNAATQAMNSVAPKPQAQGEADGKWRQVIIHPSVIILLGKRGSGKSALGYRLLELCRYGVAPYALGLPSKASKLLPDWIGTAQGLDDIPQKSIVLVDEAYLKFHSRESLAARSREMSRLLNLSRQRNQTLIFVSQEARQIDKNIASSANVVVFKNLGILQLEFDRPELSKIATEAKQAFETIRGDKRRWSYVYSPESDFMGLLENLLPTFWSDKLSHAFAAGGEASSTKIPKTITLEERIQKAKDLRQAGLSLGQIAKILGVSKGTAHNYVMGYPPKGGLV